MTVVVYQPQPRLVPWGEPPALCGLDFRCRNRNTSTATNDNSRDNESLVREAVSVAAAKVLLTRFPNVDVEIRVRRRLGLLGIDANRVENCTSSSNGSSSESEQRERDSVDVNATVDATDVGCAVALNLLDFMRDDGSCESTDFVCPEFYAPINTRSLNPEKRGVLLDDPNRWQRLDLRTFTDQSGLSLNGYPPFTGPQWGFVRPLALQREDRSNASSSFDGVYFDQGFPPLFRVHGDEAHQKYIGNFTMVMLMSGHLNSANKRRISTSPADGDLGANNIDPEHPDAGKKCQTLDSSTLCRNNGQGHRVNPATGNPYEPVSQQVFLFFFSFRSFFASYVSYSYFSFFKKRPLNI